MGLTALVLATGYLRPRVDMDYRFSLLKPARAMLSASFLVWFADSARAVLTRVRPATPARLLTLLGWTACLAVALLVKVPQAPPCAREVATGRLTPETLCAREDLPNLTSVGNGLVRGINSSLAGDVNSGGFFFWGVWADQLNVLLWLMEAGSNRGRQGSPLSACMARLPVLALPGRDGTDLTYLAADHRVKFHQLKTRNRFALSIPPGPRQLRDLVVRARTGDPAKLKLTLRQGARKIPPSGSWSPCGVEPAALFALFKLEPGGGELQIEVR